MFSSHSILKKYFDVLADMEYMKKNGDELIKNLKREMKEGGAFAGGFAITPIFTKWGKVSLHAGIRWRPQCFFVVAFRRRG